MAKKKKSKKAAAQNAERNKKIALISAIALATAGVFVSAGMGIKAVDNRAAELITSNERTIQINWGQGESGYIWMPISERARINNKLAPALQGSDTLSWHPLYQASRALADTGWVNGDPVARWTDDGSIIIDADWRVPAAVVRDNGRDYLIDFNANVLPLDYAPDQSNQFVIHNPALPNPGTGNQWDEPEIRDALKLLAQLRANDLLAQVEGIDLGTNREHGILQIITNGGGRIMFGGGPGRSRPAEMPSEVKIERLVALQTKTGRIDAGAVLLDVRGQDITMKRHDN
ncbi:MAG: hypothetical protein JJ974_02075 [Phycisphaerales bacterium]|nr:hypothetical protein [Phycisphaerales bacterium]